MFQLKETTRRRSYSGTVALSQSSSSLRLWGWGSPAGPHCGIPSHPFYSPFTCSFSLFRGLQGAAGKSGRVSAGPWEGTRWRGTPVSRSVEVSPFTVQIPDELLGRGAQQGQDVFISYQSEAPGPVWLKARLCCQPGTHSSSCGRGGKREVRGPTRAQPAAPRVTVAHRGRPRETPAARDKQIDSQWLI